VYPPYAEFFYLTRIGVVFLLQALMRVVGNGDIAFRILTAASFLLFAGATLAVARRHVRASLPALVVALLLTPGLAELGFYFNDNVVSASLGMLGLLLLPVAAGFSWLETGHWSRLVALGALVSAGILVVFAASYAASGATVIDALQIGRYFDNMQAKFRHYSVTTALLLLFFGLPNLMLLPLGAWQVLRGGDLKRVLVLVGLLLAYMGRSATQARHFYPLLAPFVVMHGARGLTWIATALTAGRMQRRWAVLWLAGTAAVWLALPVLVPVADGPRAVVGRLWSPLLWFRWQAAMGDTLEAAARLAEPSSQVHRIVVLTTNFDPDHFLRLRLWQHGWRPFPAAAAWPGCDGGFEAWRRGVANPSGFQMPGAVPGCRHVCLRHRPALLRQRHHAAAVQGRSQPGAHGDFVRLARCRSRRRLGAPYAVGAGHPPAPHVPRPCRPAVSQASWRGVSSCGGDRCGLHQQRRRGSAELQFLRGRFWAWSLEGYPANVSSTDLKQDEARSWRRATHAGAAVGPMRPPISTRPHRHWHRGQITIVTA